MNQPIKRREALGAMAAGATLLAGGIASSASANETNGPLKGNIRQSVSRWCFGSMELEDLAKLCVELGLVGIDLVREDDCPVLLDHGLIPTMYSNNATSISDGANDPRLHDQILERLREHIPKAASFGAPNIIVFSGERKGMNDYVGMMNCAKVMREAVKIAEDHDVVINIELLNSKVDHRDYMCDNTKWGASLCEMVGSPYFKLLYDIYHMQIMEGDIIRMIQRYHEYIGHYHTAGNPGRNELDDTQELNYRPIMKAIVESGYTGFVAHEYIPKNMPPVESLRHGVLLCDV